MARKARAPEIGALVKRKAKTGEFDFELPANAIHNSLEGIASKRGKFRGGFRNIHSYRIEKLKPVDLPKLVGKVVTLEFGDGLKNVMGGVHSHMLLSAPVSMEPDMTAELSSSLFTGGVESRRPITIINLFRFKDSLPVSKNLFLVDLFRGSAPRNINKKTAQNKIISILNKHFMEKEAVSATGMVLEGPKPLFGGEKQRGDAHFMIAFSMFLPKEDKSYGGVGYSRIRRVYQNELDLAHEDEGHKAITFELD